MAFRHDKLNKGANYLDDSSYIFFVRHNPLTYISVKLKITLVKSHFLIIVYDYFDISPAVWHRLNLQDIEQRVVCEGTFVTAPPRQHQHQQHQHRMENG